MPNSFFDFKQFRIEQDHCAMKVTTDACLFGAIADLPENGTILDIGTGTGVVALMAAQRTNCFVDGIEIDKSSADHAQENVERSPFCDRIKIQNEDARQFTAAKKYDCIISNPPFFRQSLKSKDENHNRARHDVTLSKEELLDCVKRNLKSDGTFSLILPALSVQNFISYAIRTGLFLARHIAVQTESAKPPYRSIITFQYSITETIEEKLAIEEGGRYSPQFIQCMKPFYKNL